MNPDLMRRAIALAVQNVKSERGGPFAALITRDDEIVAAGTNIVTSAGDPTAHAEITAIRRACDKLGTFDLSGCALYTSCEPCPMCFGAVYWARLDRVYYAATHAEAAQVGFDDSHIYEEIDRPPEERSIPMQRVLEDESWAPFKMWTEYEDRIEY